MGPPFTCALNVPGLKKSVSCLAFSTDGLYLAIGFEGGSVLIFDVTKGVALADVPNPTETVTSIVWHPKRDGCVLVGCEDGGLYTLSRDADSESQVSPSEFACESVLKFGSGTMRKCLSPWGRLRP